jgi:CelD/BcsL family acetyltransferase involved in cellulose biosynthesis
MQVREYNSVEELAQLRDAWRRLHEQTPQASFFQSLDWLEVYWRHHGARQRLRVLALEDRDATTGILPLVVRRERTKLGSLRFLTYPLDYWGSFYGPIGANPHAVWAAGLDYLRSAPRDWDVLEPRWVGGQQDDRGRLERLLCGAGMQPVVTALDSAAVIELDGTWDEYFSRRTAKWRNNYRRWGRRIDELGKVTHVRHRPTGGTDGDPRWDLYDQCREIAKASWQGSSKTGTTLTHSSVADFLRDVHEAAAHCGGLDLNLLYLNERPIAFAYNYHFRGQVFGLRVGYDPELKNIGAGNLLYARVIEDSFRRGDWRYDIGPGTLDAKRQLWTDVLPIYRLSCFRSYSLRHQLLRLKRRRDARKQAAAVGKTPAWQAVSS